MFHNFNSLLQFLKNEKIDILSVKHKNTSHLKSINEVFDQLIKNLNCIIKSNTMIILLEKLCQTSVGYTRFSTMHHSCVIFQSFVFDVMPNICLIVTARH